MHVHPSLPHNSWAHLQLAVLRLCTGSVQRMCFIDQIISERPSLILQVTNDMYLHWILNAGTKWHSRHQKRFFAMMRFNSTCKWTPKSWPFCFCPSCVAHENQKNSCGWPWAGFIVALSPPVLYHPFHTMEQQKRLPPIWQTSSRYGILCSLQ